MSETEAPKGRVLSIAGSDSGGGAGIQADIKSITMNGGFAMTAVTAITVQNTQGVSGVIPVPTDAIAGQINVTLSDIGADAIKTGMLGDRQTIETVMGVLADIAAHIPRVIDPVMVATSGDKLLADDAVEVLQSLALPDAALVTPNAPEAEILTGRAVTDVDGQRRAAERLLESGAKAALVKGGHVGGDRIVDVLQTQYDEFFFESDRIETTSTHGTGCTLASAIATHLALGAALPDAVDRARSYLLRAIQTAKGFGSGHGPVNHGWPIETNEES